MASREDDEDDIDPVKMLFPLDEKHCHNTLSVPPLQDTASGQQLQNHYIPSIESTLVIRQLPSQGLSFKLWPAATTLVTLLDQYRRQPSSSSLTTVFTNGPDSRPLNILELGSGTGMVGMAAAAILGAKVTVTDLPHVIPNLQFNVDANAGLFSVEGGTVHVATLRWGEADDVEVVGREFDVILASDVVYHDHLYDPLLETLRLLLNSGVKEKKMTFVMAHLRRWKKDSVFFKRARKLFNVEIIHVDNPCDGSRIGVVVYRMTGKATKIS